MVKQSSTDHQERLETFLQHLEEARQLQREWMTYGINCVDLYVEDVDADWQELWREDEDKQQTFVESVTTFLKSNDRVAVRVRKQLTDQSLTDIAAKLEKYLSFPEEDQIFLVKNMLSGSLTGRERNRDSSDENNEIELLDLAEGLLKKLAVILKEFGEIRAW